MSTFAALPGTPYTKRAIVLGATGAIGSELVATLMHDTSVQKVVAVTRNTLDTEAEKRAKVSAGIIPCLGNPLHVHPLHAHPLPRNIHCPRTYPLPN